MTDDRNDRSKKLQERFKPDKKSKTAQTEETDKPDKKVKNEGTGTGRQGSKTAQTDKTHKTGKTEQTGKPSVKERPSVLMYLPDDLHRELDIRFDEVNAKYKRTHGDSLEKNRDWYPAVIKAGLEGEAIEDVLNLE